MCGIAGIMNKDGRSPSSDVLDGFARSLAHRGPDGEARHVSNNVGLVQTRLAIIDLAGGDQPFLTRRRGEGPPLALVANGEIYNYLELQAAMDQRRLQSKSDCEPPLHLYIDHGLDFADHLRGMYAIAIHDPDLDRLILSRDPFGIKPLYYAETDTALLFASEPQAILDSGLVERRLNQASRDELLALQFTTGRETPFAGIFRVLPGETLVFRAGRAIESRRLAGLPSQGPRGISVEQALRELDDRLNDTVGLHQRADVPYGMFLSGGIDSSVLIAMMDRLNAEPVQAYTAGFSGTDVPDERAHAKLVAKAAHAEHTEIEFSEKDFWSLLPEVAARLDDPAADYAVLPTYKLARQVHADGLKVVLSGEGGDEMFAGYGRYRRAMRSRLLGGRAMRRSGTFENLGVLRRTPRNWRRGIDAIKAEISPNLSRLQRVQAEDCAAWLPNDLLTKLDRCLMAHGVEGRVPLIDRDLADFAFRLPDRLKIHGGHGKWLLRKWLETGLPECRPMSKKQGFTVPVATWIAAQGAKVGPLVAAQPGVAEVCAPGAVEALFRRPGKREGQAQWALLFYALWHNRHILGQPETGGVFETLAAR